MIPLNSVNGLAQGNFFENSRIRFFYDAGVPS